jgi:hypothetical protein
MGSIRNCCRRRCVESILPFGIAKTQSGRETEYYRFVITHSHLPSDRAATCSPIRRATPAGSSRQPANESLDLPQHISLVRPKDIIIRVSQSNDPRRRYAFHYCPTRVSLYPASEEIARQEAPSEPHSPDLVPLLPVRMGVCRERRIRQPAGAPELPYRCEGHPSPTRRVRRHVPHDQKSPRAGRNPQQQRWDDHGGARGFVRARTEPGQGVDVERG